MSRPMISVAGMRGVVGDSLLVEEFVRYLLAFGTLVEGRPVVVGTDSRLSREMMRHLAFAALQSCGCDVHDIGLAPTPTVGLMARLLGAGGGIAITASHNPAQWNAYKFFGADGTFLNAAQNKTLLETAHSGNFRRADYKTLGRVHQVTDAIDRHLARVLEVVDVESIRRRAFRVVVDCVNGVGSVIMPPLLEQLGVQADWIDNDPNREFPRNPEPLPENLGKLRARVRETTADLGMAIDPDADRLAIVDETGRPIGEERSVVLGAEAVLAHGVRGPVVVNLSTTRAVDDVAARYGCEVHRTPIGEAHVVGLMKRLESPIGGEGNGGVIYPRVHAGRDSATAAALVLDRLAATGQTMSALNASIPDYAMVKIRIETGDRPPAEVVEKVARRFEGRGPIDRADGVKLSLPDRWVHVRASGTEPIVRAFAEAPTEADAQTLLDEVRQVAN